jgi:hypothetical protein
MREPTKMRFPVSGALYRPPAETWWQYAPISLISALHPTSGGGRIRKVPRCRMVFPKIRFRDIGLSAV